MRRRLPLHCLTGWLLRSSTGDVAGLRSSAEGDACREPVLDFGFDPSYRARRDVYTGREVALGLQLIDLCLSQTRDVDDLGQPQQPNAYSPPDSGAAISRCLRLALNDVAEPSCIDVLPTGSHDCISVSVVSVPREGVTLSRGRVLTGGIGWGSAGRESGGDWLLFEEGLRASGDVVTAFPSRRPVIAEGEYKLPASTLKSAEKAAEMSYSPEVSATYAE